MIAYIKGTIEHMTPNSVVIETGGIGYAVFVSAAALSSLKRSQTAKLHTYMNVKEDGVSLYGFLSPEELDMFQLLITVSGIGPKLALMVLSSLTPSQLALAIITEDGATLATCQGVGKKTAQRMTLELRDKIKTEDALLHKLTDTQQSIEFSASGGALADAIEALIALGFSKSEAAKACMDVSVDGMGTDMIIKAALKKINQ